MVEPLSVNTDGVRALADIHTRVAARLADLSAGTPEPTEVAQSHGSIAYGVTTALAAALDSRSRSLDAARSTGENLAELLHQAARAYERVDELGGAAIDPAPEASTGDQ